MRLKQRGSQKINKELNVLKIIKSLRDMKILMKSKMLDKETKFEIAHSRKNIIDIDEPTSSSDFDEDEKEIKKIMKKERADEDSVFLKKNNQ